MSRAVVFSTYGGPEVLHVIDVEPPQPSAGQVRVHVKAAGVQPFDSLFRSGAAHQWVPARFPPTASTLSSPTAAKERSRSGLERQAS